MKVFKEQDTWYISFFTHGDPMATRANRKYARATRAFKREADAKLFAGEIIQSGGPRVPGH
jgi:hypothetical protein